ncbi:hypothetical protein A3A70_00280 [candidate division WWE3 bacterium RIFCSPLOWO2_01_FULL_42_11]|uniref:Glycosyltransferase subfamily 4-like N-terminal domain-containing protein n=1 Tax=candidate division WWE3 bacterium RIFCSPLOWO2_01_FULL_42_11 TaxID=1802627 RepID=A0A1F4VLL2_UNCKA|nr:MAG: hypothetical protein A3A70_00280 [candidate division WWE3 bacterium RIFCSPLOWO2_01_FULL_42_11]
MKIVQYIHSLDIGGAEIHTLELCKGLVKLGHEVIIVGPEGSLGSEFEKARVKVIIDNPIGYKIDFGFIARQIKFLKIEKPQVVHCHEFLLTVHGLIAGFRAAVPVRVVNVHSPLPGWNTPIYKKIPNLILNFVLVNLMATDVIALTHATRKLRLWGELILPWKIRVIPNGIEIKKFSPQRNDKTEAHLKLCRKLKMPPQTFVIGTLSRLSVEKGVDVGIKGFMEFLNKVPNPHDFHLVIAGEGVLKSELEELVAKGNKNRYITFLGEIEEGFKPSYLWGLDLFLFPTKYEGFGLVLTEAMVAKSLTLSSNLQVLREITEDGRFGYHFKKSNPNDLCKTLRKIIDSTHSHEKMLEGASEHVSINYSLEKFVKSYAQLYENSLRRNTL